MISFIDKYYLNVIITLLLKGLSVVYQMTSKCTNNGDGLILGQMGGTDPVTYAIKQVN